jgi:hypothetical protein
LPPLARALVGDMPAAARLLEGGLAASTLALGLGVRLLRPPPAACLFERRSGGVG